MLKPNTIILTGVFLMGAALVPMVFPEETLVAGIVLLLFAVGQAIKPGWIQPRKDLSKLFTMRGLSTYLGFAALVLYGARILAEQALQYHGLAVLSYSSMALVGLIVIAMGGTARKGD